jgi:hypothetical protein
MSKTDLLTISNHAELRNEHVAKRNVGIQYSKLTYLLAVANMDLFETELQVCLFSSLPNRVIINVERINENASTVSLPI